MRVNIDAAGKDDHAGRVDGAAAVDVGDDAAVGDADVLDDAVDVVGGVVDFAAGDAKHCGTHAIAIIALGAGVHAGFAATAWRMRRMTSSSVGYGDISAGLSGSGISSMR